MNRLSKLVLSLSLLSLAPVAGHAADAVAPRQGEVNHRLHRQHRRIRQGVKSGELTKSEAKGLRQEDRTVRQEERDMRKTNGGTLTPADKKALNQQENEVSKDIREEKHDGETR